MPDQASEIDQWLLRAKKATGRELSDDERSRLLPDITLVGDPSHEDFVGYLAIPVPPDDGRSWAERFGGDHWLPKVMLSGALSASDSLPRPMPAPSETTDEHATPEPPAAKSIEQSLADLRAPKPGRVFGLTGGHNANKTLDVQRPRSGRLIR
ncbi:MAG: hypothetical protein AAGB51_13960 [Planctomycetota bacterium]